MTRLVAHLLFAAFFGTLAVTVALTERGAGGVAQEPGATAEHRRQSAGLDGRRTENAGVIAPPARPRSASVLVAYHHSYPVNWRRRYLAGMCP